MTNTQYLLLKLMEECSEVAMIASKTIQFGYESSKGEGHKTNIIRLKEELNDILASVEMLNEECDLSFERDEVAIENKKIKVRRYRELVDIQDKPFLPYIDRTQDAHSIEE